MAIQQGKYDIDLYRGDSKVIELTFYDVDNTTGVETLSNLSTINVSAQVRYSVDSPDVLLDLQPAIVDATKGLIRITISSTKSGNVAPAAEPNSPVSGVYDLQFKDKANAEIVFTPIYGSFTIRKDVTRP